MTPYSSCTLAESCQFQARPRTLYRHFLPSAASAQSRTDCNAINSRILKQAVHYCVHLPPDYDANDAKQRRYPVLYFLHGLGQNEQTLFSTGDGA